MIFNQKEAMPQMEPNGHTYESQELLYYRAPPRIALSAARLRSSALKALVQFSERHGQSHLRLILPDLHILQDFTLMFGGHYCTCF